MEIEIKDVKYKNIENLNLVFKESEITSIIGECGSGKTAILNLIYGLEKKENGEIKIGDFYLNSDIKKIELMNIREYISYLSENYRSELFNINILEDIKYGLDNFNKEKLNEQLKLFNLNEDILNRSYSEISNGERKKVLLISMFLKNSKIILLDNPNSGLDRKSIQSLVKLLRKEKRNGKTIILTSHDSNFLLQVSDRVVVLNNEKVIMDDEKFKVFEKIDLLNKINMEIPKVLDFEIKVKELKNIKLGYRDNINDLLKDVYRNAK